MARTPEEQKAWELSAYGMYAAEIDEMLKQSLSGPLMLAMGICSDIQEILNRPLPNYKEDHEKARQHLNVVKYIISKQREELRRIEHDLNKVY